MKILKLEIDYMNGPIWKDVFDPKTCEVCTGIKVIDDNEELAIMDESIQRLYSSFYIFNDDEQSVIFDKQKASENKQELIKMASELLLKINEIQDGSFTIQDNLTEELKKL